MDNKCFISIIIPVYNVEKYLPECLDSILKHQKFRNFEVILIDDGSSDASPEICDRYAEKDSRVKAIHKKNGGASQARNEGIRRAEGKYVLFIDSDDFIADNSIENIATIIKEEGEVDLVFLNSESVFSDGLIKPRDRFKKEGFYRQSHKNVLNAFSSGLPDCVWGKLIKREVMVRNDIYFTEGIICEDVDFIMKLFMHVETCNTADCDFYYYRDGREGSVMDMQSGRVFIDLLYIITKWAELAETTYKEYSLILYNWILQNYCLTLIPRYGLLPKEDKKRYKRKVDELNWLLKYAKDKRVMIVKLCYKLFGLNVASGFMNLYSKFHEMRSSKGSCS